MIHSIRCVEGNMIDFKIKDKKSVRLRSKIRKKRSRVSKVQEGERQIKKKLL